MTDWILAQASQPLTLFFGLVVLSFILEDLATLTGAAMAASQPELFPVALGAVLTGIVVGDLGLYGIGYYARRHPKVKQWLQRRGLHKAQRWLKTNLFTLVLVSRLTPGLRLPSYTACGLVGAHFGRFATYAVGLVIIWTIGLFFLTASAADFADRYLELKHSWWVVVPLLLIILFVVQRVLRKALLEPPVESSAMDDPLEYGSDPKTDRYN